MSDNVGYFIFVAVIVALACIILAFNLFGG